MTPAAFADWLRGFMDAAGATLTADQVAKIREKIATVVAVPFMWPTIWYSPYEITWNANNVCAGNGNGIAWGWANNAACAPSLLAP